jgi:RNA polymerase sigma-70 factor, ECF subfamily
VRLPKVHIRLLHLPKNRPVREASGALLSRTVPEEDPVSRTQHVEDDWAKIVRRIAAGDDLAAEELYLKIRSMQMYFERKLGAEHGADAYHDLYVYLLHRIRIGAIREPERILGYVHAIAKGQCIQSGRGRARIVDLDDQELGDPAPNPEQLARNEEMREIAMRVLRSLSKRDREMLIRFYLDEQDAQTIQKAMGLTLNQFRLIKSRAKRRFEVLCLCAMDRDAEPTQVSPARNCISKECGPR